MWWDLGTYGVSRAQVSLFFSSLFSSHNCSMSDGFVASAEPVLSTLGTRLSQSAEAKQEASSKEHIGPHFQNCRCQRILSRALRGGVRLLSPAF